MKSVIISSSVVPCFAKSWINSQIKIHEKFGGVVPEIASRNHIEVISDVTKEALMEANIKYDDIDHIACTYGPGLVGALLVGVSYAKALSYALDKPLVPVNHLEGHIAANYITYKELEPPFLCLLISGGNTHLVYIEDYTKFKILGSTRDDAIGEAYDKVARVIGLDYPGGPKIDKLAKEGKANIELPKTHLEMSCIPAFRLPDMALIRNGRRNPLAVFVCSAARFIMETIFLQKEPVLPEKSAMRTGI